MPTYLEPIGVPQWSPDERPTREQFNQTFQKLNDCYAGINTEALTRAETAAKHAARSAAEAQTIKDSTEIEFSVDGDRVGFKRPNDVQYQYTDHLTGPTGKPLRIAGSFPALSDLETAYPAGDGDNSYLVGGRIHVYADGWKETDVGGATGSVNGQSADASGNITLAAANIPAGLPGTDAATVQEAVSILKRDADGVREYFTPEGEAKSAAALGGITGKPVAPYVHTKTGTVHNLTGPSGAALIYFTATDVYQDGDTWTLNGTAVTATYHDGQALLPTAVIAGDVVEAVVQGDTVRLLLQKPTPQPNLLINGLFDAKHLVNQRRLSEYTANAYTADMWFLWNPGKAALTDNGIVLSGGAGESTLYQLLPTLSQDELITITAKIDGKIYTASGKTGLGIFQLTPNGDIRSYFHGGYNMVLAQICISEGKSVLATSFKVEPGPRFTGWHEPKPGETLAECQRYQVVFDNHSGACIGQGDIYSDTAADISVALPSVPRITPSVRLTGAAAIWINGATEIPISSENPIELFGTGNQYRLRIKGMSGLPPHAPCFLDLKYDGKLIFDANL